MTEEEEQDEAFREFNLPPIDDIKMFEAFTDAIAEGDPIAYLVFGDWLEEKGETELAQNIRKHKQFSGRCERCFGTGGTPGELRDLTCLLCNGSGINKSIWKAIARWGYKPT